ncbi:LuxR family transcriptional regulator, partial [Streptomyces afghaniensis]
MGSDSHETLPELSEAALAAYELALRETALSPDTDVPGVDDLARIGLLELSPDDASLRPVDPRLV